DRLPTVARAAPLRRGHVGGSGNPPVCPRPPLLVAAAALRRCFMTCPRCDGPVIREYDSWWCIVHGSFGFQPRAGDRLFERRHTRFAAGRVAPRQHVLNRHAGRCPKGPDRCSTCREWAATQKGEVA